MHTEKHLSAEEHSSTGAHLSAEEAEWVGFGPFEKRAKYTGETGMPGPGTIRVPDAGEVRLDASELLPSRMTPMRDETVVSEVYGYTSDEGRPLIVGVVQTRKTVHYRRHSENMFITYVLGISPEAEPRTLTRFTAYRGEAHEVSLIGGTELGVVTLFFRGATSEENPGGLMLLGVDAARGTDVWRRIDGVPLAEQFRSGSESGTSEPLFFVTLAPETRGCSDELDELNPATGVTLRQIALSEYAAEHSLDVEEICAGRGGGSAAN